MPSKREKQHGREQGSPVWDAVRDLQKRLLTLENPNATVSEDGQDFVITTGEDAKNMEDK